MNGQKRRAREKMAAAVKDRDFKRDFAAAQNSCRGMPCGISHRRCNIEVFLSGDLQNLAGALCRLRARMEICAGTSFRAASHKISIAPRPE